MAAKFKVKKNRALKAKSDKPKAKAEKTTAYCFKCQEQQVLKSFEVVQTVNGRIVRRGICGVCGGKTSTMMAKGTPVDRVEELPAEKTSREKGKASSSGRKRIKKRSR